MLCERCKKNEANYYYRENVNGIEKAYHLCGECAASLEKTGEIKGLGTETFFDGFFGGHNMTGVFASLFAPSVREQNTSVSVPEKTKCSLCGASFEELAKEGKAGCPKCYEVFEDELKHSISRIHGRTCHTGKEPIRYREKNETRRKISSLEAELKEAVKNENYERAAELRDEIKTLRSIDETNI